MKRIILTFALFAGIALSAQAQRFCIVDMDYILSKIPQYEEAQENVNTMATEWKTDIDLQFQAVEKAYTKFQAEQVLMTEQMKKQKIEEIEALERKAKELQKTKFGPEGELFKKRQELIKPIQDNIYEKIELYAKDKSYEAILDKSSAGIGILYFGDRLDKSEDVLRTLGY
ncbi:MAG: outer membrane protein [Chitinophagales bacterium]|jgi:outer membrane protein